MLHAQRGALVVFLGNLCVTTSRPVHLVASSVVWFHSTPQSKIIITWVLYQLWHWTAYNPILSVEQNTTTGASTSVSSFCISEHLQKQFSFSCNTYHACRTSNGEKSQRGSLGTVCCMSVWAEVMLAPIDFSQRWLAGAFETASAPALRWWLT